MYNIWYCNSCYAEDVFLVEQPLGCSFERSSDEERTSKVLGRSTIIV
jgi:hypothetical protein